MKTWVDISAMLLVITTIIFIIGLRRNWNFTILSVVFVVGFFALCDVAFLLPTAYPDPSPIVCEQYEVVSVNSANNWLDGISYWGSMKSLKDGHMIAYKGYSPKAVGEIITKCEQQ